MNEIRQRELANRFRTIESKLELLNLINDVIDVLFNSSFSKGPKTEKKIRHFTLAQLNYYALASKKRKQYTSFIIAKKNGNDRHIKAPVKGLKVLQKCVNYLIQVSFEPTAAATGFVPGRSILDNAKKHVGKIKYLRDQGNFRIFRSRSTR